MILRILFLSIIIISFFKVSDSFAQEPDLIDQELADVEDAPAVKSPSVVKPSSKSAKKDNATENKKTNTTGNKKINAWKNAVKAADESADDTEAEEIEAEASTAEGQIVEGQDDGAGDVEEQSAIAAEVDVAEKADVVKAEPKKNSEKLAPAKTPVAQNIKEKKPTPEKTKPSVKDLKSAEVKRTVPLLDDNRATSLGKSKLNSSADVDYGVITPGTTSPNPRAIFENPSGREKVIKVYHPSAEKGLIRINKDRSYQYSVPSVSKTKAMSVSLSAMTSPTMSSSPKAGVNINYKTMYGEGSVYGVLVNYEWMPFQKFGSLGLFLETGLSTAHGAGTLVSGGSNYPAQETYTLLIIPMSAFLKYRMEYWANQWLVPYVEGGATYYGLGEIRSGDNKFTAAGSMAAGGGGGLQINLSKFDQNGSLGLSREYGVANLWLNFEMRAMAGLKSKMDFTNTTFNFGMVADY